MSLDFSNITSQADRSLPIYRDYIGRKLIEGWKQPDE